MYISEMEKGFPNENENNKIFDKLFFKYDKEVCDEVIDDNLDDAFIDKFNKNKVDKMIRKLYEKNFIKRLLPKKTKNLDYKEKKSFFINKAKKNDLHDIKIKIMQENK